MPSGTCYRLRRWGATGCQGLNRQASGPKGFSHALLISTCLFLFLFYCIMVKSRLDVTFLVSFIATGDGLVFFFFCFLIGIVTALGSFTLLDGCYSSSSTFSCMDQKGISFQARYFPFSCVFSLPSLFLFFFLFSSFILYEYIDVERRILGPWTKKYTYIGHARFGYT